MINDVTHLPDFPALQQLARALWRNGSVRGAALLVGAGFTRNAVRPGVDTPAPPLWSDLVRDLVSQLYPHTPHDAPANPLRIAEEYRKYFGQAALDDFIRTRFPDRAWMHGPLHAELLGLPWSDVLTTNWDTLLERAAEDSMDYVYELVRSEADLTYARSPRIVKLHGSIGDVGPLIFAEEDYRTYPAKHAAFVNLARQVFIENELCLLGFSGEDPNFLQWAGWVRDQLGGSARRIYLVGNLHLPDATRKYLEAQNIAPIDLAPLVEKVPPAERHTAATRLFFDELKRAQPAPAHEWKLTPTNEYPLPVAGPDAYQRALKDDAFAAESLNKTRSLLKADRDKYPGWLVCPRNSRQSLQYRGNEVWLLRRSVLDRFEPEHRAELLYELLWPRTTAFLALEEPLVQAMTELLEQSTPTIEPSLRCEFAIALMRNARLSNHDDALDKWGKLVEAEASANSPSRIEAQYQRCLRARDRLDLNALAASLTTFDAADPVWRMRRAALHAEIGEYVQATRLIKEAAGDLDKRHRLDRGSLWVKSRLGWANWLSRGADAANLRSRSDSPRPREFKELLIDPSNEIEMIENAAEAIQSKRNEEDAEVVPSFDPGHYRDASSDIQIGGGDPALAALFELDQLIEVVGLPIRLNNVSLCGEAAISTVKIVYQQTVTWYVWLLRALHSHYDKPFNRYFGRIAIAKLSGDVSATLISITERGIAFWFERIRISQGPEHHDDLWHAVDQLRLLLIALSRLTVRMSEDNAKRALLHAFDLAKNLLIRHPWLLEALGDLARYAAAAIPRTRQGALALAVMEFPLSVEKGCDRRFWPDTVKWIWESIPDRPKDDPRWQHRIQQLIVAAGKGQPAREEAILRLAYLTIRKALTKEEEAAFGRALWSDVDGQEYALPSGTGLLASTFAQLPSINGIDPIARVRSRLFDVDLQAILALPQPLNTAVLSEKEAYLTSLRNTRPLGLTLDSDLAVRLFDQVVSWEPKDTDGRDPLRTSMMRGVTNRLRHHVGDVLACIVVPAMDVTDRTEQRARVLLEFGRRTKAWRSLPGLPYFVATASSITEDISTAIRRGLVASEDQHVGSAAIALVRWGELVNERILTELPRALVEQLIATIETRHEHGLHSLLGAALSLLKDGFLKASDAVRLMRALSDLLVETQYADVDLDSRKAVVVSLIRVECVKLATALQAHVHDDGSLHGWIDDAKSDSLPEVRFSIADV
jgi:hypothetical protein